MGESEDLTRHIEDRRNRLNNNIGELERKAKDALDWRVQVEQRPGTMLGLAFGVGILLSAVLGSTGSSTRRKSPTKNGLSRASARDTGRYDSQSTPDAAFQDNAIGHAWDNIKGALVGVALTRAEGFLEDLVPGITDQYHKAEARHKGNELGASSGRIN